MVTASRPGPPVPPPPPSPSAVAAARPGGAATDRSGAAPSGRRGRGDFASPVAGVEPIVVTWVLVAFVAVVMYAVSVPIDAAVYHVHVAAAFGIALVQVGSLLLAMWNGWAAAAAFLAGQAAFGLLATADPGMPWPVTVTQLILLCALLVLLVLRGSSNAAAALWLGAIVVPLAIAFVPGHGATPDGVVANLVTSGAVSALVLSAALGVTAWRARLGAALDDERRVSAAEHERRLIAEERTRIAREMHDVIAHGMSIIQVQASSAPYRLTGLDEAATAEFAEIAASARSAMAEMRALLGVLRDPAGEPETAPQPGLAQLPELVASVERAGVPVSLEIAPGLLDGGPTARAAYRIVQESLSNVLRHAPGAATLVRVERASGPRAGLDLVVRNAPVTDAAGEPVITRPEAGAGHGLVGMRERVRMLGGRIESGETVDGGFEVRAMLPLAADGPAGEDS
ncbi:Signal transduction histidine kinase [Agromyces sp. CF514]|uniref:sensor histidine kinase n=1 Tax=Agromyces sp. CF514 TaxID=1881031 RepID=UPI0008E18118|nr:histidine kinase [Agromyces sp. CF514]SFR70174.1 Signal transduction histidine kinase [Agromyces sp. CF514]